MFCVPVPTEQLLEQLVKPRTWKLIHGCGNSKDMEKDEACHESAPKRPMGLKKRNDPPVKLHTAAHSVCTSSLYSLERAAESTSDDIAAAAEEQDIKTNQVHK